MAYNKKDLETLVKYEGKWREYDKEYHNPARGQKDYNLMLELGREFHKQYPQLCPNHPNGDYFIRDGARQSEPDAFIKTNRQTGENRLADYVGKHYGGMLGRFSTLNPGALYGLNMQIPAKKTGYAWHDKIVRIREQIARMQSYFGDQEKGEQPDIQMMEDYIIKNVIKGDKAMLLLYQMITRNRNQDVVDVFKGCVVGKMRELQSMFLDPENKISKHKLRKYAINTIEGIRGKEGKNSASLKGMYLELAQHLNDAEKKHKAHMWKDYQLN